MKKIIITLIVVVAVAAGWFLLTASDTYDYVAEVDSEISELENELATLDAQVTAGTLSEEQATAAKVRIVTRLNAINQASTNSENAKLTPAQREQLVEGLDRLKMILVTYQETLTTIESTANDTDVKAELARRGESNHGSKRLNLVVADIIAEVEETIQDYEPDTFLDEAIDEVVEETEAGIIAEAEAEMFDEQATTTDETAEESTDDEMSDDEVTEDDSMLDTSVSADADQETTPTN